MRDSYEEFIKGFGINYDDYLEWGIQNTIYPPVNEICSAWSDLKERINRGDEVYIRGYGRNGKGNELISDFYSSMNINIKIDPTNNMKPTHNLQSLTGLRKKIDLYNYQVSHIFGHTKNVYMFEAPWNICFVPKMFDPLTGHEALGTFPKDYKGKWLSVIKIKFQNYIEDYNTIMRSIKPMNRIDLFISQKSIAEKYTKEQLDKFKTDMGAEFSTIQ